MRKIPGQLDEKPSRFPRSQTSVRTRRLRTYMTAPSARRRTAVTALALALSLAVPGCGAGIGGDDDNSDLKRGDASASPPSSAPAGTTDSTGKSSSPSPSSSTPDSKATPKGGVPEPGDVDQKNADEVGKGALTAMWTYDTAVDSSPQDASVRAADAGWLTGSYSRQLREHSSRPAPGAQWQKWSQHRAYATVELARTEDAGKPDDTGTVAWRQWTLTTTLHGRDGWTQTPITALAYVHLVRTATDKPWRVSEVTVR